MERSIKIKYWWKCPSFPNGNMPAPLASALEESAMERITNMLREGYISGELCDNVNIDVPGRQTPADGFECTGWFTIKAEEKM